MNENQIEWAVQVGLEMIDAGRPFPVAIRAAVLHALAAVEVQGGMVGKGYAVAASAANVAAYGVVLSLLVWACWFLCCG